MNKPEKPTTIAEGKRVRLVRRGDWEYVTRKKSSGIVAIVAVTDDRKLVLVEQFRPPVAKSVIELPAGLAGDAAGHEQEDLTDAARRELLEETGYEADSMEFLAEGYAGFGHYVADQDSLEGDCGAVIVGGHGPTGQTGQRHREALSVRRHHLDRGLGRRTGRGRGHQAQAQEDRLHNLT